MIETWFSVRTSFSKRWLKNYTIRRPQAGAWGGWTHTPSLAERRATGRSTRQMDSDCVNHVTYRLWSIIVSPGSSHLNQIAHSFNVRTTGACESRGLSNRLICSSYDHSAVRWSEKWPELLSMVFFCEQKGDRTCNISENAKARTVKGSFFPQKIIARRFLFWFSISYCVILKPHYKRLIWLIFWYDISDVWTELNLINIFLISLCLFENSSYNRFFVHFQYYLFFY